MLGAVHEANPWKVIIGIQRAEFLNKKGIQDHHFLFTKVFRNTAESRMTAAASVGLVRARGEIPIQVPQETSGRPPVQTHGQGAVQDPVSLIHVFELSSEHRVRGPG